jgi:hypothetical protein
VARVGEKQPFKISRFRANWDGPAGFL